MTTSYPVSLPTASGLAAITLTARDAVAYNASPFTYSGQAQSFGGQRWEASVTLPPLKRNDAMSWVTFLQRLRGQFGTFTMGDPLGATPRGAVGGSPVLAADGETGEAITISGASASVTDWLLAGDYVQIGTTLHQVVDDVDTDGSGEATLLLWPFVRTETVSGSSVITSNTVGRWRLASNERSWSVDSASIYGISFSAIEAIT